MYIRINPNKDFIKSDPSEKSREYDMNKGCSLLTFGAMLTPYVRFSWGQYRLVTAALLSPDFSTIFLCFYAFWSYGFLIEKHIPYSQTVPTFLLGTLITQLASAFIQFGRLRDIDKGLPVCLLCSTTGVYLSIYIFMLWDVLEYNIVW